MRGLTTLLALLTTGVWPGPGQALASQPEEAAPSAFGARAEDRRGPTDPEELVAFLDGLMAGHLAAFRIAGATVAVVRDGTVLVSRGYGWADVDRRVPVDPATTLFQIGSTTKLLTWTAVMQLRDEGRLDLDADVNEYLDFQVPDTFQEPVTLRHLLTHTPGFEDHVFGLFRRAEEVTRREWLEGNLPKRVYPPGERTAYSNYGAVLAGYVVERVAGVPWEEYIERRILAPLGMEYATGRQPVPDALLPHMSEGYTHRSGRFVSKSLEAGSPSAPAGSVSASAHAMAAFMIAYLQGGSYGDSRILSEATVREMFTRAPDGHPRVNSMALGFYEKSSSAVRVVGHGGGMQWFFTDLALFPEEGLGVFVSYNSEGGAEPAMWWFMKAFMDHYFPTDPAPVGPPDPGWEERAAGYTGEYRFLRRSHSNWEKLIGALGAVRVSSEEPGAILVRSAMFEDRLIEVEPGFFRSPDGFLEVGFLTPVSGPTELYFNIAPQMPAERVGGWHRAGLHLGLFGFAVVLFGSVLVLMPARYVVQRVTGGLAPLRGAERWLRWVALGFAVVTFAFLVAVSVATGDMEAFMTGRSEPGIRAALLLPFLVLPLAVAVAVGAVVAFRRRLWSPVGRVHFALVAVAAIVFTSQLAYWNLFGWG